MREEEEEGPVWLDAEDTFAFPVPTASNEGLDIHDLKDKRLTTTPNLYILLAFQPLYSGYANLFKVLLSDFPYTSKVSCGSHKRLA